LCAASHASPTQHVTRRELGPNLAASPVYSEQWIGDHDLIAELFPVEKLICGYPC
jgi:hypothetical protein